MKFEEWKDKEEFYCKECKQTWILVSNDLITNEQHNKWLIKTVEKHNKQCKNKLRTIRLEEEQNEDNFD